MLTTQLFPEGDLSCFIATPYILPAVALFPCTPDRQILYKTGKNGSYGEYFTVGLISYYKCTKYNFDFWEKRESLIQVVSGHLQE